MDHLVSHDWLAAHLNDASVVALDATLPPVGIRPAVDVFAHYLDCHLPGAVFFDIEALSEHATTLPHMLPTPGDFARNMADLGVSDSARIVVYEQQGVFSAPRAWWMLRTFGAQRVSVLDGGLAAWIEAGHPTEAGPVHRPAAQFTATLDATSVADLATIRAILSRHGQLLDARSAARFYGTTSEPRAGLRSGHMPGAISLPFTELIHDGRLLAADQLRAAFTGCGVDLDRPITTTCGSGVTAAVLALALEIAGARQVNLYDGSWAEYASQPGAVIAADVPDQAADHAVA
jgi:thiosulfate/3-mercaptopyruvate sulfurtransferase